MIEKIGPRRPRKIGPSIEALEGRDLMTALPIVDPSATHAIRKLAIETAARVDHTPSAYTLARDGSVHIMRHVAKTGDVRGLAKADSPNIQHRPGRAQYDTTVRFSYVGAPGNASVPINGFVPPSKATVPAKPITSDRAGYQNIGGVPYVYAIAQTEITAGQYVTFLNKVDPNGDNPIQPVTGVKLWVNAFSPVLNPFSGQINLVEHAKPGAHYQLAASYWRDKPLVNGNMFHFAYFANSMYNGTTVAIDNQRAKSPVGTTVRTQTRYVKLSTDISTGMYDLEDSSYLFFKRLNTSGYVIPSENEWIKAAYFSPRATGNGTHYYYYPTVSNSPPTALQTGSSSPTVDGLGNIIESNLARGVAYSAYDQKAIWQPPYANGTSKSGPNVVNVGKDRTPSPWLTYDQGGNVVEYTDTAATPPADVPNPRGLAVYVKVHGGIANATTYQLWLTATGTSDPYGQKTGQTDTQGGARFGYVPNWKADRLIRTSKRASSSALAAPKTSKGLVYRLDNLNTLNTFYTTDLAQAASLANDPSTYLFLGASFDQPTSARSTPVYGFLNTTTRTQFYTTDKAEAAKMATNPQYVSEGVAFTALAPNVGSTNFRRFFNAETGAYAYSAANADIQFFTSRGYTFEGFAWSVD